MADLDPIAVCMALKEAGAEPSAVAAAAKENGLDRLEAIRLLRSLFGLSLHAAKDILALVDPPSNDRLPQIETREQLLAVLSKELGYCGCASGDAMATLVGFLRAAKARSDSTSDSAEFTKASLEVEASLPLKAAPGFADWFVYGLEQRDLVSHNFRVTDVWITSKGRWLLDAIERIWSEQTV